MTEMIRWNPLRVIPSFVNTDVGSLGEMESLYQAFETMNLPIMCQRDDTDSTNVGYLSANGMLARLTPDTGIMVNPVRTDSPVEYEFGYVYSEPQNAIAWLLCRLGFAANALAFERDVLIFHILENPRPLRLSFDGKLNEAQYRMYSQLAAAGTHVEHVTNPFAGIHLGFSPSN